MEILCHKKEGEGVARRHAFLLSLGRPARSTHTVKVKPSSRHVFYNERSLEKTGRRNPFNVQILFLKMRSPCSLRHVKCGGEQRSLGLPVIYTFLLNSFNFTTPRVIQNDHRRTNDRNRYHRIFILYPLKTDTEILTLLSYEHNNIVTKIRLLIHNVKHVIKTHFSD